MRPGRGDSAVEVTLDGAPIPIKKRGADVQKDHGKTIVTVGTPRMYRIISENGYGTHTLTLRTSSPGLEVYSFTFGACEMPRG